jgi:hypothetical protein
VPDADLLRRLIDQGWGVDLHSHSRHSDGAWTPTELIRDSLIQGVRVMALTDHDTVAGQAEMLAAGAAAGMAIVTGAEVTTRVGDNAYHLLYYDLDPPTRPGRPFRPTGAARSRTTTWRSWPSCASAAARSGTTTSGRRTAASCRTRSAPRCSGPASLPI